VARFVDQYTPCEFPGYPCVTIPRWSTQINGVRSGDEQANQLWEHPLHTFMLPSVVRRWEHVLAVQAHWYAMRGPAHSWPFRDPLDFASVPLPEPNVAPATSGLDCLIGVGDGETTEFQLVKRYSVGSQTYDRKIYLPIVSTVAVTVGGVSVPFSVSRATGVVTLDSAPLAESEVRAGFLYDVQVRFESDESFSAMLKSWRTAGFSDVTLTEVRGPAV
jgi:uncharacterized protein (TIGR02217 family)